MTTTTTRDLIDVGATDHARARSESVPSALDILSGSAGTTTTATDATNVLDMTDAHAVLRERESNGGRLVGEQPNARDGETDEEVLDLTDGALAERAVNAGRPR